MNALSSALIADFPGYRPILDPVGDSLGLSAIFAALPLLVLFVLLGVLRLTAWLAALVSLLTAVLVAVIVYSMPIGQGLLAGTEGAAFGFFPIMWIVINAVWIYTMTVVSGHFDVLRRSFAKVSQDQRVQAVIIAFCFGALLEALAGFGTPVAISSVVLIALGFRPIKAASVALVANTAPVAFGALAVPITTLSTVTGLSEGDLGAMVGRQTPVLAVFVPLALVYILDRGRGVREVWPVALVCGAVFGLAQFVTANYLSVPLADVVAALLSAAAVVGFLAVRSAAAWSEDPDGEGGRVAAATAGAGARRPGGATAVDVRARPKRGGRPDGRSGGGAAGVADQDSGADMFKAYSPYLIIVAVFVLAQIPPVKKALDSVTVKFDWPGLDLQTASGKASTLPTFNFNWLLATGTLLLIAGLITALVLRISPREAVLAYGRTLRQLAAAIVTVMAVLALAYVMNSSGQTATLGSWMAAAGGLFALISPLLGWLGVAVTGSDTSSNSLFGAVQITAAGKAGLDPLLMAAGNSSGGVLGKMISPQNLAIAAAAVGMAGREGDLFRRVLGWSLLFVAAMCLLVYLQSTAVLSWMVP
jgi:lactate permease